VYPDLRYGRVMIGTAAVNVLRPVL
jgi:hypothetical protein